MCNQIVICEYNSLLSCFLLDVSKLIENHVFSSIVHRTFFTVLSSKSQKNFEPRAGGLQCFCFDWILCSLLSSIKKPYPGFLKFALVLCTSCFPGRGRLGVLWELSFSTLISESKGCISLVVLLLGVSPLTFL